MMFHAALLLLLLLLLVTGFAPDDAGFAPVTKKEEVALSSITVQLNPRPSAA